MRQKKFQLVAVVGVFVIGTSMLACHQKSSFGSVSTALRSSLETHALMNTKRHVLVEEIMEQLQADYPLFGKMKHSALELISENKSLIVQSQEVVSLCKANRNMLLEDAQQKVLDFILSSMELRIKELETQLQLSQDVIDSNDPTRSFSETQFERHRNFVKRFLASEVFARRSEKQLREALVLIDAHPSLFPGWNKEISK